MRLRRFYIELDRSVDSKRIHQALKGFPQPRTIAIVAEGVTIEDSGSRIIKPTGADDAENLRTLAYLVRYGEMTPREQESWSDLLFDIAMRIQ